MSDIVERLAKENERQRDAGGDMLYRGPSDPLLTEAADTIAALRAEVEMLKAALTDLLLADRLFGCATER